MTDVQAAAKALLDAARSADQRRLLVLHGDAEATREAAADALRDVDPAKRVVVAEQPIPVEGRRVPPERTGELLGTTQTAVVVDLHQALDPDVIGRVVGVVDGGGLLIFCTPPLEDWPARRDGFDQRLAVPPYGLDDVTGRFRERFVAQLRDRPGVAIVDVDAGQVDQDGLTDSEPVEPPPAIDAPERALFDDATYRACRTRDQARTLEALEASYDPGRIVVVEADRGRGKSSAAGLAAAELALRDRDVLVVADRFANAAEVFARAREVLADRDRLAVDEDQRLEAGGGGQVRYRDPVEAADADVDVLIVDEAASLPVHVLEDLLDVAPSLAFVTTIRGYEGAGRGFSVRFRDRLDSDDRSVDDVEIQAPIRYAAGDQVEDWIFDALMLDAEPPPGEAVADATPETVDYRVLDADALAADPARLGEVFGLLVLAHYRTRPSDLARLLDAPNLSVRALTHDDRIAAVALLAREGGLSEATRRRIYEGERVPGNMIPDVLTSQLRDPDAARLEGVRVVRIATHPDVRRRGLASHLLGEIHDELDPDWFGTSYGATPGLLRFWAENGYRTVHVATSRNPASGEHGVVQLNPVSDAGQDLHDRSTAWLQERIPSVLADALSDLDVDVARAALAAADGPVPLDVSERAWRLLAACAYGPGIYDVDPEPFRQVALKALIEGTSDLDADQERLLIAKVLQARSWDRVVDDLDYVSKRMAMRALGDAYAPLVDSYGGEAAREEADRYR